MWPLIWNHEHLVFSSMGVQSSTLQLISNTIVLYKVSFISLRNSREKKLACVKASHFCSSMWNCSCIQLELFMHPGLSFVISVLCSFHCTRHLIIFNYTWQENVSKSWKYFNFPNMKETWAAWIFLCIATELIMRYAVFLWNAIWWVSYELCAETVMDICEEQIYQAQRHSSHDECCCFCRVFGTSPEEVTGANYYHA